MMKMLKRELKEKGRFLLVLEAIVFPVLLGAVWLSLLMISAMQQGVQL